MAGVVRALLLLMAALGAPMLTAQIDQGSITGAVQDTTGAIIPKAAVTLTSVDTGLVLKTTASGDGIYVFSPLKIGDYTVTATAPGFATVTQEKIHVSAQAKVNVPMTLQAGAAAESITVTTAPPMLQTESGAVGQTLDTETINNTPLNGRNAMYIAQLAAGVVRGVNGRGANGGDFDANGQRAQQNNFVLDGVDNNSYLPAFTNQAGFVLNPPPDALSEFTVQTSNYAAELGHSAGAVMNTSIKAGTNNIHGSLWEYVRNTAFDTREWNVPNVPNYHENQFGATLGAPVIRNKLFFFGYTEANRIAYANPIGPLNVPTLKMRKGDFSELLDKNLTQSGVAVTLYNPNNAATPPLTCGGQVNVICSPNAIATKIANLYPLPNTNNGKTFNNYQANVNATANTFQLGARVDYNMSNRDQMFVRHSYTNFHLGPPTPLGYPLDGGGVGTQHSANVNNNLAFSETHAFTPKLLNEFRFGYTRSNQTVKQLAYRTTDIAAQLGLGGIPSGGIVGGGLPTTSVTGMQGFGTGQTEPQFKGQNNYQYLDNVTWIKGNHQFKAGVSLQWIHLPFFSPPNTFGAYTFNGNFTSKPGQANTGYGLADFMLDSMNKASISNYVNLNFSRYARGAYLQDDWRITRDLTLNVGVRYDIFQPNSENDGHYGTIVVQPNGPAAGTGTLTYPSSQRNAYLAPRFLQYLSDNRIALNYANGDTVVHFQKLNFAPRIGFAYKLDEKTVIRGGFGIFYSGPENTGGGGTMQNYPYQNSSTFTANACKAGNCVPLSLNLETGFSSLLSGNGLISNVTSPTFQGSDPQIKTPYSESYNLAFQRSITNNMVGTISYVGNVSRHLIVDVDRNAPTALVAPTASSVTVEPFYAGTNAASLGAVKINEYAGKSSYNSLQTKLERRFANGLQFLATYTWAHSLDDASQPLSGIKYRAVNMIGIANDYSRSDFDVRHRVTFNGFYRLPIGRGRRFHPLGAVGDFVIGGWATDVQWTAQSGLPFTVTSNLGNAGPNGGSANAILVGNPFAGGGTPPPSNTAITTCPTKVRNRTNWYNPCAFANPPVATFNSTVTQIRGIAALPYLGGRPNLIDGPGYERVNASVFKSFHTFREQRFDFRVDVFNALNHPSWDQPDNMTNNPTGGVIVNPQGFQQYTPDSRFFQFSGKYTF